MLMQEAELHRKFPLQLAAGRSEGDSEQLQVRVQRSCSGSAGCEVTR